jgi:hypothetical protein
VAAQEGHGRVLEVAVELGERARGLRDDAGAVVTDHGDRQESHRVASLNS